MTGPSERTIALEGLGTVTAHHYAAASPRATLVLSHGAGADQRHRFMVAVANGLAARDVSVITFNFLYTEQRRRTPDRPPVLEQTWRAVLDGVAPTLASGGRLVVGGKSMGGRIASQVLASRPQTDAWERVSGLVLLGYPLHPPGRPDQPRIKHLPDIKVPVLVVQGARDTFGTPEEIEPVFRVIPTRVDFEFIERGDHSFAVPKSTGRTERQVLDAVCERVASWVVG